MSTLTATVLCSAQTGNFTSTAAQRTSAYDTQNPGVIVITSVAGTTVTVNIQGSVDGANYFNIPYCTQTTFSGTYVTTALTITTSTTQAYFLQPNWPWQFVQIVATANTGMTLSAVAYL